jgi:hypothetical protein
MSRTTSQRQRAAPRYHRFAQNDGRVLALAAELDELRQKYDDAIRRLRLAPDLAGATEQFLISEAKARNMTKTALVHAIIEAVVEDRLFAALLDG